MATFRFRYLAILRYRESRRDHVRSLFAEILAERETLLLQRQQTNSLHANQFEEMRRLSATGIVDIDATVLRRYHAGQLTADVRVLDHRISLVDQQLEACRKALTLAEQETEVLERLMRKQQSQFEYEQGRREQTALEDAWLSSRFEEFVT